WNRTMKSALLRAYLLCCMLLPQLLLGCGRSPTPADETAPPAPVKWLEARQLFVEEWTELVGTTQPLPDRGARVSAAVEGNVVSVLQDALGKPVIEGQRVKKGDILIRLDDRIARANRDKVEADLDELKQQVRQAELGVQLASIEVRRLTELGKKASPGGDSLLAPVQLEKALVSVDDAKAR